MGSKPLITLCLALIRTARAYLQSLALGAALLSTTSSAQVIVQKIRGTGAELPSLAEARSSGVHGPFPITISKGKPFRDAYFAGDSATNPDGLYNTLWDPFTRLIDELLHKMVQRQSANLFELSFKDPLLLPYIGLLIKELYTADWGDEPIAGKRNYTRTSALIWRLSIEHRLQQHGLRVDMHSWARQELVFLPSSLEEFEITAGLYQSTANLTHRTTRRNKAIQTRIPDEKSILFHLTKEYETLMTCADIWGEEEELEQPAAKRKNKSLPGYSLDEFNDAPNDPFHIKSFIYMFKLALNSDLIPSNQKEWLYQKLDSIHQRAQLIFTLQHKGQEASWREWLANFTIPENLRPPEQKADDDNVYEIGSPAGQMPQTSLLQTVSFTPSPGSSSSSTMVPTSIIQDFLNTPTSKHPPRLNIPPISRAPSISGTPPPWVLNISSPELIAAINGNYSEGFAWPGSK